MTAFTRDHFVRFLGAVTGAVLGLGGTTTTTARCRKKSDRCDRGNQCCSKRCQRGFCYPRWR